MSDSVTPRTEAHQASLFPVWGLTFRNSNFVFHYLTIELTVLSLRNICINISQKTARDTPEQWLKSMWFGKLTSWRALIFTWAPRVTRGDHEQVTDTQ